MEISEHDLGRLVAEVDEQHRDTMPTAFDGLAENLEAVPSRRRFLQRAAFGGLAITVGSAVIPVGGLLSGAAAQEAPDPSLVAFAESVELSLVTAYNETARTGSAPAAVKSMFSTFAGHHQQHAQALAALGNRTGANSNHQPNSKLLDVARDQFSAAADGGHALDVGYLLETAAEATYLLALGSLQTVDAQKLSASILLVESEHAVAFATAHGKAAAEAVSSFVNAARAIDPTKYKAA